MTSTPLLVNVPHPSDLPADPNQNPWRRRSSRQVYENPWISVREDQVIRPDGAPGIYGVVHFKNLAVGALAVEGEHLYLVGQYRYAVDRYSWEIPEGGCAENEDPVDAARRELREETGLSAENWRRMGSAHLSNSATDELAIWYLATGLSDGERHPEGTEQIVVKRVAVEEAMRMVLTDEISDVISKAAIMQYVLEQRGP